MSSPRKYNAEPLIQQCQYYIAMHLEELPVSYLSLLPLSTRKDLLWQLPLADVCQLEGTKFTEGLDMVDYWKSPWEGVYLGIAFGLSHWCPDHDLLQYIQEWDELEYTRAMLYGLLTTCAIGNLRDDVDGFDFSLPHCGESDEYVSIVSLLYAVRRPYHDLRDPYLKFPPRYAHKSSKVEEDLTVPEVMQCFGKGGGELPKIFPEIEVYNDIEHDYAAIVPYYLHNAVSIGVRGHIFTAQGLEFLKAIVKEVMHLEVLILDNWGTEGEWETEYFDEFCTFLCSYPKFFSNFHLFKILSSMSGLGFTVSREHFNRLIAAYFAAPTSHTQKLQITHAKIKCSDVSQECGPKIDQKYISFKTVEFDNCQFITKYKATPQSISHWLGQGVSELPLLDPESDPGTYFFKLEGKTTTRKRKYSELDSDVIDQNEK